jgi:hypothetical protein
MVRTALQYARIAAIYERAARDLAIPSQPRAAFAKKASWFRMLAQIEAIKAGAALPGTAKLVAKKRNVPKLASGEGKRMVIKGDGPAPAERLSCASVGTVFKPIGFLTEDMLSKDRSW